MVEPGNQSVPTGKKNASSIPVLLKRAGLDGFIIALLVMILLAKIWPDGGAKTSPLHLAEIASYGVSAIFFFYGLRLNVGMLKSGLTKWRLHW